MYGGLKITKGLIIHVVSQAETKNQAVWPYKKDKVRAAMKRMKNGEAVGPDDMWKHEHV